MNPWPLGYPLLLAICSLGGLLDATTGAVCLQAIFLLAIIVAAYRLNNSLILLLPLATDSGLWLLGHAWAEVLFILSAYATAIALESRRTAAIGWAASMMLHARQPALPALLGAFLFLKDKKVAFWGVALAVALILLYYAGNAIYTHQLFGAPRPPIHHDWVRWLSQAGQALLHEACLLRNTESTLLIAIQALFALVLASRAQIRSDSARFLLGAGISYGLFTLVCHGLVAFVEDLDTRLLGPATVLIWAGLLKDARISRGQAQVFTLVLLLCGLPLKAFMSDNALHPTSTPFVLQLPAWAPPMPMPQHNPLTVEGVALGQALFHDKRLSGSGQMSCASCHRPGMAFAQRGVTQVAGRNTPSLLNAGWQKSLFWDGGVSNLESVALAPLHSSAEMGGSIVEVRRLLRTDLRYRQMVKSAFGTDTAQSIHILRSLAQYQRTLVSAGSLSDGPASRLTQQEKLGQVLFTESCAGCHPRPFYTDFGYHRVLPGPIAPLQPLDLPGNGRFRVTLRLGDLGAYKTPSLRNVEITSPYMHDGSIRTLDLCLNHGKVSLSKLARQEAIDTNQVRQALLSYLQALTDTTAH